MLHLGPAICGRCYQVGPDVFEQLTGWQTIRNRHVDLRALLAEQAKEMGVRQLSASPHCTRCDNDRFFSHRAGDAGRQVAVIVSAVSVAGVAGCADSALTVPPPPTMILKLNDASRASPAECGGSSPHIFLSSQVTRNQREASTGTYCGC